ncbi:MAG: hypothetical protein OXF43_08890 [Gammaproteobacteria bacterium]|nr:hypothetical protein [Gammaproteobacteria bacterium]
MSKWEKLSIESKIVEILEEIPYDNRHHFGRRFLTSYQIAIQFSKKFPKESDEIGKSIGGKGEGPEDSVAKYLANQLSRRVKNGSLENCIEGGFLNGENLQPLKFGGGKEIIEATTESRYSMFRLVAE